MKIQTDHSKICKLTKLLFTDKIIISDQTEGNIKTILWIEPTIYKNKKKISLNGAAYKRTNSESEFIMQRSDIIGHHSPNINGEDTIKYSCEYLTVTSLYELIMYQGPTKLDIKECNVFAKELEKLTRLNQHTEARIAISKKFEYDSFEEQFNNILKDLSKSKSLSDENYEKQYSLTQDMLISIERKYGKEIRNLIYSAL
jgi:hypothetical protein